MEVTRSRRGSGADPKEEYEWPEDGPGFRGAQHRWSAHSPSPGEGALSRLCVHPSVVDFAERALGTADLRLYQAHASAKFSGLTNYEQPMHTDRNHSWLPAGPRRPGGICEAFLYLSDVGHDDNPTRLVSVRDSAHVKPWMPVVMPDTDPALYAAERRASGPRGSLLAYRSDVFHRAAPFNSRMCGPLPPGPGVQAGRAGLDRVRPGPVELDQPGVDEVRGAVDPRELELFGFPPPGHPIWDDALLRRVALRYPALDLEPWRRALESAR